MAEGDREREKERNYRLRIQKLVVLKQFMPSFVSSSCTLPLLGSLVDAEL